MNVYTIKAARPSSKLIGLILAHNVCVGSREPDSWIGCKQKDIVIIVDGKQPQPQQTNMILTGLCVFDEFVRAVDKVKVCQDGFLWRLRGNDDHRIAISLGGRPLDRVPLRPKVRQHCLQATPAALGSEPYDFLQGQEVASPA